MIYETDLSTQQNTAQKNLWISGQNEDNLREKGDQPPTKSRQKKTCRLKLPKALRLLKRSEFSRVAKEGKRVIGRYLCIDWRPAKKGRLGISASVRYGSAPIRNRFKRLVREVYRQNYGSFSSFELNVIPRQCAKKARFLDIQNEIATLIKHSSAKGG